MTTYGYTHRNDHYGHLNKIGDACSLSQERMTAIYVEVVELILELDLRIRFKGSMSGGKKLTGSKKETNRGGKIAKLTLLPTDAGGGRCWSEHWGKKCRDLMKIRCDELDCLKKWVEERREAEERMRRELTNQINELTELVRGNPKIEVLPSYADNSSPVLFFGTYNETVEPRALPSALFPVEQDPSYILSNASSITRFEPWQGKSKCDGLSRVHALLRFHATVDARGFRLLVHGAAAPALCMYREK